MVIREAVDVFLVALRADGVKPETIKWYRHRLSRFVMAYGDKDIRKVGLDDARAYIVSMGEAGFAQHTYFTLVRVIRRLFKWMYEERKIEEPIHRRIRLPRLPQPMPKAIEMADVEALLAQCNGSVAAVRDKAIILFLLDTGCRVGGLCGLRVSDVDFDKQHARIMEKGDKARLVLFGDRTEKALRDWLRGRPFGECESLFTSMREARPVSGNTVIQMLRRLGRRAGLNGRLNPHAFRHAFAREYILNGGDLATVSEMMGHTQIAVTKQYYAVFQAEELRAKHDAFSPVGKLHLEGKEDRSDEHVTVGHNVVPTEQ